MKKIMVLMLAVFIICTSSMAFAATTESRSTNVIADIIFLKPLGAVATAFGSAAFLISWPFAAISDSSDETFEVLVREPFDYTFRRPVGEIGTGF